MNSITKENIDSLLFQLSKRLKKLYGRNFKAELVIVGGAALIINHDFRESTLDIDALSSEISSYKDIVRQIADDYNIPEDWLNSDVSRSSSYSPKIVQFQSIIKHLQIV